MESLPPEPTSENEHVDQAQDEAVRELPDQVVRFAQFSGFLSERALSRQFLINDSQAKAVIDQLKSQGILTDELVDKKGFRVARHLETTDKVLKEAKELEEIQAKAAKNARSLSNLVISPIRTQLQEYKDHKSSQIARLGKPFKKKQS